MTFALRPATPADAAFLEACAPAMREGGYRTDDPSGDAPLAGIEASGARCWLLMHGDEPSAAVAWRMLDGARAAFDVVVAPREHTRRGLGHHAVELAEAEMRRAGMGVAYAPVAQTHGIAVYFWIRLGYRPLLRGEWPRACDGVAWLSRRIDGG